MSPEAQIKILRFLQDRELTPLGSTRPRKMDVRIIAATNRTVVGPGKSGLRDDIVARLGAAPIHLPPLRNRIEDLGALVGHFLAGVPAQGPRFEQPAFRAMTLHAWPLNVRELEKIVTTAAVLTGGKPIALRDLPEPIARVLSAPAAPGARRSTGPSPTPAQLEELLRRYEGNVADVSRELGKHRAAVWRWIKKFGLAPASSAAANSSSPRPGGEGLGRVRRQLWPRFHRGVVERLVGAAQELRDLGAERRVGQRGGHLGVVEVDRARARHPVVVGAHRDVALLGEVNQVIGAHQVVEPQDAAHVDLAGQLGPVGQPLRPAAREVGAQRFRVPASSRATIGGSNLGASPSSASASTCASKSDGTAAPSDSVWTSIFVRHHRSLNASGDSGAVSARSLSDGA